jgi:signal peptidase I
MQRLMMLRTMVENSGMPKPTAAVLTNASLLGELGQEMLLHHGRCWGRQTSDSMGPFLRSGDRILAERVTVDQLRFGDIAVFTRSGRLVTHRILSVRRRPGRAMWREKGDANLEATLIPATSILGRVVEVESPWGSMHLISGWGRALQIALAIYSHLCDSLWRLVKTFLLHVHPAQPRAGVTSAQAIFAMPRRMLMSCLRQRR